MKSKERSENDRGREMKLLARESIRRILLSAVVIVAVVALFGQQAARADQIPAGWEASNMKPIGYSDIDGRGGAFKMAIRQVNGHWYLYMGHLWNRGWSIVDVTDPTNPKVAKFIPGPDNTFTIQMEFHDNIGVISVQQIIPGWGGDPNKPFEEGALIWDMSDPLNPEVLSHWKTGGNGTHRNGYPGGRYAYLSAGMPGYKGNILVILDVSDPKNPKEAGRWWMPGQKQGETPTGQAAGLHGPAMISPDGNTAYVAYAPAVIILDIHDKTNPKLIGRLDMTPPFISAGSQSLHSILPIPGKPLLFVNSEASAEDCNRDALNFAAMVDIHDPTKPRLMSIFPLPVPPKDAPYTDFCDKGGRFGPHNTNQEQHLPNVEKQGDLIYLTYFNAGLRIFDIKDPRLPKEVGWFIPPTPTHRIGPMPRTKLVNQTEDVLVDTRGNIYITDKQWGLFVLRYTGQGESSPTAQ
jgi:hypothetical protein